MSWKRIDALSSERRQRRINIATVAWKARRRVCDLLKRVEDLANFFEMVRYRQKKIVLEVEETWEGDEEKSVGGSAFYESMRTRERNRDKYEQRAIRYVLKPASDVFGISGTLSQSKVSATSTFCFL